MEKPHERASGDARDLSDIDLASDPQAVVVTSRPVPVDVVFAGADGVIETLEGPVRYRAGDALLTGPAQDRWPIRRARFQATYDAIAPTVGGAPGLYAKRPLRAWARQVGEAFITRLADGGDLVRGAAGDWLLQHDDGSRGVLAAAIFEERYRRA